MNELKMERNERRAIVKLSDLLDKVEGVADTLSIISDSSSTSSDERLVNALTLQVEALYEVLSRGKEICHAVLLSKNGEITLKELRDKADLTLSEASDKIGVAPEVLDSWEKGFSFPSLDSINKIENLYGFSYNEIKFIPD